MTMFFSRSALMRPLLAILIASSASLVGGSAFAGEPAADESAPVVLDAMSRNVPLGIGSYYNAKSQWVPHFMLGVAFDEVEEDDILLIQHYKGHGKKAKKWGKVQKCSDARSEDKIKRNFGQSIAFFNCKADDAWLNKKPGKYSARISYRQTGAGVDHTDIKTVEYTVDKFAVDASGGKKQWGFAVNQDHRLGEGWMTRFGDGTKNGQDIRFSTWLKWSTQGEPRNVKMRCYLGKKKIGQFDSHNRHDVKIVDYKKKGAEPARTTWGKYVFHVKPDFGKGMVQWAAPTTKDKNPEVYYLSENPGDYRCPVTFDGEMIRELTFTIADGAVKEPACANTTVHAAKQHHMLKVSIKPGLDPKFDKKAFASRAWFGLGAGACKK